MLADRLLRLRPTSWLLRGLGATGAIKCINRTLLVVTAPDVAVETDRVGAHNTSRPCLTEYTESKSVSFRLALAGFIAWIIRTAENAGTGGAKTRGHRSPPPVAAFLVGAVGEGEVSS